MTSDVPSLKCLRISRERHWWTVSNGVWIQSIRTRLAPDLGVTGVEVTDKNRGESSRHRDSLSAWDSRNRSLHLPLGCFLEDDLTEYIYIYLNKTKKEPSSCLRIPFLHLGVN